MGKGGGLDEADMQHDVSCPAFNLFAQFSIDAISAMRETITWTPFQCEVPEHHPVCWLYDAEALGAHQLPLGPKDVIPGKNAFLVDSVRCEELLGCIRDMVMDCTCKQAADVVPVRTPATDDSAAAVPELIPELDQAIPTLNDHVQALGRRVRQCLSVTERGLSHLRRGDLTRPSLTEAGFKAAILVALVGGMPDVVIYSEHTVDGGYVDLLVVDSVNTVAILYEIKYVACTFIQETGWTPHLSFKNMFAKCDAMTARLSHMDWDEVSKLHYRSSKTRAYHPFSDLAREAYVQALQYMEVIRRGGIGFHHEGPPIMKLGVSNIIGVSTRVFDSKNLVVPDAGAGAS